jgi:hypothetical protein
MTGEEESQLLISVCVIYIFYLWLPQDIFYVGFQQFKYGSLGVGYGWVYFCLVLSKSFRSLVSIVNLEKFLNIITNISSILFSFISFKYSNNISVKLFDTNIFLECPVLVFSSHFFLYFSMWLILLISLQVHLAGACQ